MTFVNMFAENLKFYVCVHMQLEFYICKLGTGCF